MGQITECWFPEMLMLHQYATEGLAGWPRGFRGMTRTEAGKMTDSLGAEMVKAREVWTPPACTEAGPAESSVATLLGEGG